MAAPRKVMKQYDDLALKKEAMPKRAVEVKKANVPKNARVQYIFYEESGRPMCSAKHTSWTPEEPKYCGSTAIFENGRCNRHGGVSANGMQSGRYTTGKYSKHLPVRLAAKYQQGEEDEVLHTLDNEIQLVDARLKDLLEHSNEGGATNIFKSIKDAWQSFNAAKRARDSYKLQEAADRLNNAIHEGTQEASVWFQIDKLIDTRRRLVLAEGKRLQMLGQFIPVDRVNLMLGFIVAMVNTYVTDRQQAKKLIDEILRLAGRGDSTNVEDVPATGGQRSLTSGDISSENLTDE